MERRLGDARVRGALGVPLSAAIGEGGRRAADAGFRLIALVSPFAPERHVSPLLGSPNVSATWQHAAFQDQQTKVVAPTGREPGFGLERDVTSP